MELLEVQYIATALKGVKNARGLKPLRKKYSPELLREASRLLTEVEFNRIKEITIEMNQNEGKVVSDSDRERILRENNGKLPAKYNRLAASKEGDTVVVDENLLDIFSSHDGDYGEYKPKYTVNPYLETRRLSFDIETLGLDGTKDRVIHIGFRDADGKSYIFSDEDEAKMLRDAIAFLGRYKPELLYGYNFFSFDIPFIINRCILHGIEQPFKIDDREKVFSAAQQFGKPVVFYPCRMKGVDLVDIYHQALAWDFVRRKLVKFDLESVTLTMGLRAEPRLELDHHQIHEYWESGNREAIAEYLRYDLEDTMLIADSLMPAIYYQKAFLPWNTQTLSTAGNGGKWQSIIKDMYPGIEPVADEKASYEGGLTGAYAGLYRNVGKIDVNSLYPSIMLKYGICSVKDERKKTLAILKYITTERLRLKKLGEAGDKEADQQQGTMKVLINSAYGFLGTSGVSFNDMTAAALVTAYGRRILRLMMETITSMGGTLVSMDTDGVYYSHPDIDAVADKVREALPDGIGISLELKAKGVYVPGDAGGEGLRKTYIIVDNKGKVKSTGKYRKRDRSILEKTFEPDFIKAYIDSPDAAKSLYKDIRKQLIDGNYPTEKLSIKRKIKPTEKALLRVGKVGDVVTFWTIEGGLPGNDKPYDRYHYLRWIDDTYKEMMNAIEPPQKTTGSQMSLF